MSRWSVAPATLALLLLPDRAHASLLSPELEDAVAKYLALFVLFIVPVVLIVLFWMVHVLPEKIAHKRHHPQLEAIRTLCLLSLVFGGLLWPLAWIWAFSKPVLYKLAYGTDRAHDGMAHEAVVPTAVVPAAVAIGSGGSLGLHERLARLEARHVPESELTTLRADLAAIEAKYAEEEP